MSERFCKATLVRLLMDNALKGKGRTRLELLSLIQNELGMFPGRKPSTFTSEEIQQLQRAVEDYIFKPENNTDLSYGCQVPVASSGPSLSALPFLILAGFAPV